MNSDIENTPEYVWSTVLRSIGLKRFGTDPCTNPQSTVPANLKYMLPQNGLELLWTGVVWCNCPYSRGQPRKWMERFFAHEKGGVALLKADPATKLWQDMIWPLASRVVFLSKRVRFESPLAQDRVTVAKWPSALIFSKIVPGRSILEIGFPVTRRM